MGKFRPADEKYGERGIVPVMPTVITDLRQSDYQSDPLWLTYTMMPGVAKELVQAWRSARDNAQGRSVKDSSKAEYAKATRTLQNRYAIALGIEVTDLSPLATVTELIKHSVTLSKGSWTLYRAALLWHFDQVLVQCEAMGWKTDLTLNALGVLIVQNKHPHLAPVTTSAAKPVTRAGSIKQDHFAELITRLPIVRSRGRAKTLTGTAAQVTSNTLATGLPVKAQSFAIATLATGLRPGEWRDAVLRPATMDDMTLNTHVDIREWDCLIVNTSKRKFGQPELTRTILIRNGYEKMHVQQHMAHVAEIMKIDPSSRKTEPMEGFIKGCSTIISTRCKEIWPTHKERWVTLYSMRHQARANFAAQFGVDIAHEMMGHGEEVGRQFYTSRRLGYKSGNGPPSVLPGHDCSLRGRAAFEQRKMKGDPNAMKPWNRQEQLFDREAMTEAPAS